MTGLPDVAAATRRQLSDISHGRIGILTVAPGDRDPAVPCLVTPEGQEQPCQG
jgi:hypothetical protein